MSKHLRKMKCKREYAMKYFLTSLLLMIFVCLMIMLFRHGLYNMTTNFINITYKEFYMTIFSYMTLWKILFIQFALAPLLAFIWAEKSYKNDDDSDDYISLDYRQK